MRRALIVFAICALAALAGCGPNIGKLEKGEEGTVAASFGGDALELDSGLRVFLAEIDAPGGDQPYARAAAAELDALTAHREVLLAYGGAKRWAPSRTRDGEAPRETAIAHVFVKSEGARWFWLQHELVARGAAFVRTRGDNHARADQLLRVEAQARAAKKGLWADPAYAWLKPEEAAEVAAALTAPCQSSGTPFRFVAGAIERVDVQDRRASLVFSTPAGAPGFSIVVFGRAFSEWRGTPLAEWQGKRVRVRGRLETFHPRGGAPRAQICLDDAGMLEVAPSH